MPEYAGLMLPDVRAQDMASLINQAASKTALDRIMSADSVSTSNVFNNFISSVDPDSSIG